MAIVTLDEAKAQLGIPSLETSRDTQLLDWIDAITKAVENYVNEVVERRTIVERQTLRGDLVWRLWSVPVISLTSVVSTDGVTTWDVSDFDVDPDSGVVETLTGFPPYGRVVATYEAGYETIPYNYKQGGLVILQHIWETQRGVGQVGTGVIGQEEGTYGQLSTYSLPRKALEWLGGPSPMVG